MEKIAVDIGKFPEKVQAVLRRTDCVDADQNVLMDADFASGGIACYCRDTGGWSHPAVIVLAEGRKVYALEDTPPRSQDSSDLEEFQDIIRYARNYEEKDKATCEAVTIVYEQFVIYLAALNWQRIGSEAEIRARRGRIQKAKLTAVRLWREGALKKIAPTEKEDSNE